MLGGLSGYLISLGALTIPGIGPVVAAGSLFTALAGALLGAETGTLVGVLNGMGVADYEAKAPAESVRQGRTLVIVKAEESKVERAREVMQRHRAERVEERRA